MAGRLGASAGPPSDIEGPHEGYKKAQQNDCNNNPGNFVKRERGQRPRLLLRAVSVQFCIALEDAATQPFYVSQSILPEANLGHYNTPTEAQKVVGN